MCLHYFCAKIHHCRTLDRTYQQCILFTDIAISNWTRFLTVRQSKKIKTTHFKHLRRATLNTTKVKEKTKHKDILFQKALFHFHIQHT